MQPKERMTGSASVFHQLRLQQYGIKIMISNSQIDRTESAKPNIKHVFNVGSALALVLRESASTGAHTGKSGKSRTAEQHHRPTRHKRHRTLPHKDGTR
ncbi:hypothetical protein Nepgr_007935 [Nepenthes gracilis]|uniref:Uncharacterized protein n=1 Tax=Nepenthes gracilis TaxID=150966 RepID=A0AAD3S7W7_NEPGR|nr:hypothetical protein Nepgr_007935 [Nepenthes gracilis]